MATYIWVNIDTGNGLLPDDAKPLHKQMLTSHPGAKSFTWRRFTADAQMSTFHDDLECYASKIIATYLRVNELNDLVPWVTSGI